MQNDTMNFIRSRKSQRMTCTVCMKPNAVRYYIQTKVSGERVTKMVYEHRDEPPKSWSTWNGKRIPRYRRCHAGIVRSGLPILKDISDTEPYDETEKNYKREFADSIKELSEIMYDVSGDDAKRILKNIWRWVEQKQIGLGRDKSWMP